MSGSGGGRLPSFKAPRDLTLGSSPSSSSPGGSANLSLSASASPSTAARPKRVYKPNIPPRRDRGGGGGGSSSSEPHHHDSSGPDPSYSSERKGSERGGERGRGRGGRGRGRGRGVLIQSESLFAEGVGDPLSMKTHSRPSQRGGRGTGLGGGGRGRMTNINANALLGRESLAEVVKNERGKNYSGLTSGGGSSSSSSLLTKPKVKSKSEEIKEEIDSEEDEGVTDKSRKQNKNTEVQDQDLDEILEIEDPHTLKDEAVSVPLTDYFPDLSISSKIKIEEESKRKVKGKKKKALIQTPSGKGTDFLQFAGESGRKPVLSLFQLPSHLPIPITQVKNEEKAKDDPSSGPQTSPNLINSLESLPEGRIGTIQYLSNGSCRLVIEGDKEQNIFEIEAGKNVGFRQDLVSIDLEGKKVLELGAVQKKFLITPDIDSLMGLR